MGIIIHGDCLEVLRKIEVGEYKAVFMDPPDNIGMAYHSYIDKRDDRDYYGFIERIIMEALIKVKVIWVSYHAKHDLEIKWMLRDILKYRHPSWSCDMFIWRYTFSQYQDRDCAYGYRPMIRLKRSDAMMYPDAIRELSGRQLLGDRRAAGDRVPDNVWSVPRIVGNSPERKKWIPTQHPIKLLRKILLFTLDGKGERLLDLFGGSGSMLHANDSLINDCVSWPGAVNIVEQDLRYCELIREATSADLVHFGS